MNRMLFIQKPSSNEIQSFKNAQYQEIINGKKIHDTNIKSYRKDDDILILGHIDDKSIYYNSRQNRHTPFRNKKVSFSKSISTNRPPIIRDSTPFHLMIRTHKIKTTNNKGRTKKSKPSNKILKKSKPSNKTLKKTVKK